MSVLYYLAYGSNLHPLRLIERVPSAQLMFTAELKRYQLCFHKRGQDDSGKCNMQASTRASDRVFTAVYQISAQHKPLLDDFEGLGDGYLDHPLTLHHQGREYQCFSYFAQPEHIEEGLKPYDWYKSLVLQGARYLCFPEAYIAAIEANVSVPDQDQHRRDAHQALIRRMAAYAVPLAGQ